MHSNTARQYQARLFIKPRLFKFADSRISGLVYFQPLIRFAQFGRSASGGGAAIAARTIISPDSSVRGGSYALASDNSCRFMQDAHSH
jgi:hypothetical protein